MPEPMLCCRTGGGYCDRCDLLVGLDGLHVIHVERDEGGRLVVEVESEPTFDGVPCLRSENPRNAINAVEHFSWLTRRGLTESTRITSTGR